MSDNKTNLNEMAAEFRHKAAESIPESAVEVPAVENASDDDELVIGGIEAVARGNGVLAIRKEEVPTISISAGVTLPTITEDDLRAEMPSVSDEYFKKIAPDVVADINMQSKSLIIEYGLTPQEAKEAITNQMKKKAFTLQKEWLEEHPKMGIVEVNKRDSEKLEFTPDERARLQKAKIIRLVEVEDTKLKTLNVKTVDRELKAKYIAEAKGSLTQDSVPLIGMSDYVTFEGIQVLRLYSSCMFDDDELVEAISKKASVIYDAYVGGINHSKKQEDGKVMSYPQFINFFKYFDMDMALFSVLCASSPETTTAHFSCSRCHKDIPKVYNVRSIVRFDNVDDAEKKYMDDIIGNRTNQDFLKSVESPLVEGKRFESPASNNIYDMKLPSIAKAMSILQFVDKKNEYELGLFSTVVFIDTVWLPHEDGYIDYSANEPELFWQICHKLPQEDLDAVILLRKEYGRLAIPSFEMDIDCVNPECKHHMHNVFSIDDLIFQRAQDLPVGTELSEN